MSSQKKTAALAVAITLGIVGVVAIGSLLAIDSGVFTRQSCITETLPSQTVSQDNPAADGKDGSRTICKDNSGKVVSDTTTSAPVNRVVSIGSRKRTKCINVTSYDYNWSNDMYCTRPDNSTFYTSYAGARAAESQ